MIEAWARLLLSEGSKSQSENIFFAKTLQMLSRTEMELMEVLVRNSSSSLKFSYAKETDFHVVYPDRDPHAHWEDDFEESLLRPEMDRFVSIVEMPGSLVLHIFTGKIDQKQPTRYFDHEHADYREVEYKNWQLLEACGLARLQTVDFTRGEVLYWARCVAITELGASFFFACHDPEVRELSGPEGKFVRNSETDSKKPG